MRVSITNLVSALFLVSIAMLFAYFVGFPSLDNGGKFQFYADTPTYEMAYTQERFGSLVSSVNVDFNYVGPLLLLKASFGNRWISLAYNLIIYFYCLNWLGRIFSINKKIFIFLTIASPLFFSSLIFVNKEILSLLAFVMFMVFLKTQSYRYLVISLIVAYLARWHLAIFFIVFWASISGLNPFRKNYFLTVLLSGITLSFLYRKLFVGIFSHLGDVLSSTAHQHDGSGIFVLFHDVSMHGLYILIFLFKFLFLNFSLGLMPWNFFNMDNFYNSVVISLHSALHLFLWVNILIFKRKIISSQVLYFILMFALFFSLTTIFSPRYFFLVYVMACILISSKEKMTLFSGSGGRMPFAFRYLREMV